jgi:hypothetical protein
MAICDKLRENAKNAFGKKNAKLPKNESII